MKRHGRRLCILWLGLWLFGAALAGFSSPMHHLERSLAGPAWAHPLGFDSFGRDLLTTVLRGSLLSIAFAGAATLTALVLAVASGCWIASAPDAAQALFRRFLEGLLAFPYLLLAFAWAAIRGPGWDTLIFALLIGAVPVFSRLVFVRARELLTEDYVLAAQSMGAPRARIVVKHLIPGVLPVCRAKLPYIFAQSLMAEATLSFIGIGASIGRDSWGSLLAQGKDYLLEAPHLALGAGIPLVLTILSLQILSESDMIVESL